MPSYCKAYAKPSLDEPLHEISICRRDCNKNDVKIQIQYCGVCHSDIHVGQQEWGRPTFYPLVPGHEILGVVQEVGTGVTDLETGDTVGVGCFVRSCEECACCKIFEEQHCTGNNVRTYNSKDLDESVTYGGYSQCVVVDRRFVFTIPKSLDKAGVAPLLCAGITTYAPLMRWGANLPGKRIGVVGLGGLGHMVVKFARAWGNEVVVVSRSSAKEASARAMGATHFVAVNQSEDIAKLKGTVDVMIDCVAATKPLERLMSLMKMGGVYCFVGLPMHKDRIAGLDQMNMVFNRVTVAGSYIGGTKMTQEMLDFCGSNGVVSEVEIITIDQINDAWRRVVEGDVKYRFVIDVQKSFSENKHLN